MQKLINTTQLQNATLLKSAVEQARMDSELKKQIEAMEEDIAADEMLLSCINLGGVEVRLLSRIEAKIQVLKDKIQERKLGLAVTKLITKTGGNEQAAKQLDKMLGEM
jgi:hypothetical protein